VAVFAFIAVAIKRPEPLGHREEPACDNCSEDLASIAARTLTRGGSPATESCAGINTEARKRTADRQSRHNHRSDEADYRGGRAPEENSFYEEVAKALRPAEEIVIVGDGTGRSSAAAYLSEFFKTHHWDTFQKILATKHADLSAVAAPEIEIIARKNASGAN
jgi:hypothetical protein